MDVDVIIKRLNATSFFQKATYTSFILKLEVYTEYLGKESVQNILDRTFIPFGQGEVEEIRALLDAVFAYFDFEKGIIIETLSKNLRVISNSNLKLFNRRLSWLESFLGRGDRTRGKEEIKSIVREKKSLNIIDSVNIRLNRETGEYENETEFRVGFLRNREIYDQEELIDLFKSNPRAFSRGDLSDKKITYLEQLLEVEESVEIEGQVQVKRRDGKAELDWVIQNKSFEGIVNFKIYKNKEGLFENKYVKFLQERGLEPWQIANLFKSDPLAFSIGDLSDKKITYLERYLGKGNRNKGKEKLDHIILKNRGFRALALFDYNDRAQIKNRTIDVLENDMHFSQDQVIEIMENHFSKLFIEELTEATSKEYIEKLIKKVSDICQKSLSKAS